MCPEDIIPTYSSFAAAAVVWLLLEHLIGLLINLVLTSSCHHVPPIKHESCVFVVDQQQLDIGREGDTPSNMNGLPFNWLEKAL